MRGTDNLQLNAEDDHEVPGTGQQQAHHAPGNRTVAMRRHVAGTREDPRLLRQQRGPCSLPFVPHRGGQLQVCDQFGVDRTRCRPQTENKFHSGDFIKFLKNIWFQNFSFRFVFF